MGGVYTVMARVQDFIGHVLYSRCQLVDFLANKNPTHTVYFYSVLCSMCHFFLLEAGLILLLAFPKSQPPIVDINLDHQNKLSNEFLHPSGKLHLLCIVGPWLIGQYVFNDNWISILIFLQSHHITDRDFNCPSYSIFLFLH